MDTIIYSVYLLLIFNKCLDCFTNIVKIQDLEQIFMFFSSQWICYLCVSFNFGFRCLFVMISLSQPILDRLQSRCLLPTDLFWLQLASIYSFSLASPIHVAVFSETADFRCWIHLQLLLSPVQYLLICKLTTVVSLYILVLHIVSDK